MVYIKKKDRVVDDTVEDVVEGSEQIAELEIGFGREDLNLMRDKLNETIRRVNEG